MTSERAVNLGAGTPTDVRGGSPSPPSGDHGVGDRILTDGERSRRILDTVDEAIVLFEPDSLRVRDANETALRLFESDRADTIGRPLTDWIPELEPGGLRRLVAPILDGDLGTRTVILTVGSGSNGSVPVEVLLQTFDLSGSRLLLAIARDIRERLEAQVRLQRLAEAEHARAAELNAVIRAMGEGVVVCASDGTITLANPAAQDMFPTVEERSYEEILGQLDDPDGEAPSLRTAGGPVELAVRGDGDRWVELSTYPVTAAGVSVPTGETIVVMRDVTEARRRDLVRETFVGVLSHELRTPVTTIFGGAKLLAREGSGLDDATRRSVFMDIHDELERLLRLVEDLVALNRFGDSSGDIGMEPVLLQRLLPGVVASEEARWPGVSFTLDVEPGLPTVTGDATYVEQVVRNLLSNAAKYGGAGSSVSVSAEAGDIDVTVRILDDGPGFSADEAERLFELFYRSPETATAASGAGIGLFVCARLIHAMAGRIWARPRSEGGAEFGFTLPLFAD